MRYAGIDIGSRTIELVVVDEAGRILGSLQAETGFDPMARAREMTEDLTIRLHNGNWLWSKPF